MSERKRFLALACGLALAGGALILLVSFRWTLVNTAVLTAVTVGGAAYAVIALFRPSKLAAAFGGESNPKRPASRFEQFISARGRNLGTMLVVLSGIVFGALTLLFGETAWPVAAVLGAIILLIGIALQISRIALEIRGRSRHDEDAEHK